LWIYVNAFILLLGFEINASIDEATRKDLLPNEEREAL
jgi:uncharacterized BrkB/YihY/UPF0761 family membrane protein